MEKIIKWAANGQTRYARPLPSAHRYIHSHRNVIIYSTATKQHSSAKCDAETQQLTTIMDERTFQWDIYFQCCRCSMTRPFFLYSKRYNCFFSGIFNKHFKKKNKTKSFFYFISSYSKNRLYFLCSRYNDVGLESERERCIMSRGGRSHK